MADDNSTPDEVFRKTVSMMIEIGARLVTKTLHEWSQAELATFFSLPRTAISSRIKKMKRDGFWHTRNITIKPCLINGKTYTIEHYPFDVVMEIGYQLRSGTIAYSAWLEVASVFVVPMFKGINSQELLDSISNEQSGDFIPVSPTRTVFHRQVKSENYRAMQLGAIGTLDVDRVMHIYERQSGKCFYCSIEVGSVFALDHYIPLSKGGANVTANIVISCPHCNHSKGDKLPDDFLSQ